jgi:DNA-binding beta-propeller fold protein YncE
MCIAALMVLVVACDGGSDHQGNSPGNEGPPAATSPTPAKSWAGKDPAPDFPSGLTWFNVRQPLTMLALRGKVVILDFWTQGCINCQHIIPDLKQLEEEFGDALAVVGVHSGKYSNEHEDESVREAIGKYGLAHPVVNDPDFAVWNIYGVSAWPTLVLIDPAGNLVGLHAGEGVYPLFRPIVQSLVAEFDAKGQVDRTPLPFEPEATSASAVLPYPADVAVDAARGKLYIADSGHNRVLVADLDGRLELAIGTGAEGFADGRAGEAMFRQPQGLALSEDSSTLFVADTRNHAVRSIDVASGDVRTIAGTGTQLDRMPVQWSPARETALASPWDVLAIDGRLFVSMAGVHQIWEISLEREQAAVFAGTSREGIQDGPRIEMATLAQPSGLASDGVYLYWVDPESSSLRRVPLDGFGDVETLVGTGLFDYGDVDAQGTQAQLQHAQGLSYADGTLFVGDTYNHKVRAVDSGTRQVSTVAGTGVRGWDDGAPGYARFDEPGGLAAANGKLYVADTNNHLVRVVDLASGAVSTLLLSNLGVATAVTPGEVLRIELPAQDVAPGAGFMEVAVTSPEGYHLNSSGPSRLRLDSANASVAELGERDLTWTSDEPEVRISVPVQLGEGETRLTAQASVYYCRGGEEALCFVQAVEVEAPIRVRAGATAQPALQITLPEAR